MKRNYTILDAPFKLAMVEGHKAAQEVQQDTPPIVGGAAIQLYTSDPLLFRPTNDVDISPRRRLKNAEIKKWGVRAGFNLSEMGHNIESRESRMGYQVEFLNLEEPFFLHLDNITKKTWELLPRILQDQYERARTFRIRDQNLRVVSPEDSITSKLYRLCSMAHQGLVTGEDKVNTSFLREGLIDDVMLPTSMEDTLEEIVRLRYRTTELLSKQTYREVKAHLDTYKAKKDLFDILAIISAERNGLIRLDRQELKKSIEAQSDIIATVHC